MKPIECRFCHKIFINKHELRQHVLKYHDISSVDGTPAYICHICDLTFKKKGTRNLHIRRDHKVVARNPNLRVMLTESSMEVATPWRPSALVSNQMAATNMPQNEETPPTMGTPTVSECLESTESTETLLHGLLHPGLMAEPQPQGIHSKTTVELYSATPPVTESQGRLPTEVMTQSPTTPDAILQLPGNQHTVTQDLPSEATLAQTSPALDHLGTNNLEIGRAHV
jgi:hypothetical protein